MSSSSDKLEVGDRVEVVAALYPIGSPEEYYYGGDTDDVPIGSRGWIVRTYGADLDKDEVVVDLYDMCGHEEWRLKLDEIRKV